MKNLVYCVSLFCVFFVLLGCITPPFCGNGICEASENNQNCPSDCEIQLMTCSALGGITCATDETCSTYTLPASDSDFCCIQGQCRSEQIQGNIIAIVDSNIYPQIQGELDQWILDLASIEKKQVEIKIFSPNIKNYKMEWVDENTGQTVFRDYLDVNLDISEAIRNYIITKDGIESVVIIGNIYPAPIKMDYIMTGTSAMEFFDYYFVSKDVYSERVETPTCISGEGYYTCVLRFFDDGPDMKEYFKNPVGVGRITPNSNDDVQEIKDYFRKAHNYRVGNLRFNEEVVIYMPILDERIIGDPNSGFSEEKKQIIFDAIKSDFNSAFNPISIQNNDASFLLDMSGLNKANLFYSGHGSPRFMQHDLAPSDIINNNFLFTQLYSCSTGAFFEKDYIAGRMLFEGNSLIVNAPTRTLIGYDWGDTCDPKGPGCDFFYQTILNSGATFSDFSFIHKTINKPEMYAHNFLGDITLRTLTNNQADLTIDKSVLDFGELTVANYCNGSLMLNLANVSDKNVLGRILFDGQTGANSIPYQSSVREFSISPNNTLEVEVQHGNGGIAEDINGTMTIIYTGKNPIINIPIIGNCIE